MSLYCLRQSSLLFPRSVENYRRGGELIAAGPSLTYMFVIVVKPGNWRRDRTLNIVGGQLAASRPGRQLDA